MPKRYSKLYLIFFNFIVIIVSIAQISYGVMGFNKKILVLFLYFLLIFILPLYFRINEDTFLLYILALVFDRYFCLLYYYYFFPSSIQLNEALIPYLELLSSYPCLICYDKIRRIC